jgi:hypothetical protein
MAYVVVAAYAALAGTAVTAYGQVQAGKAQQESLERQAEEEKLRASTEELARREELNRALAANQLAMASGGISGVTPESISLEGAKKIGASEQVIGLSEKLKQAQLQRQAQVARTQGIMGATSTLLSSSIAQNIATIRENSGKED